MMEKSSHPFGASNGTNGGSAATSSPQPCQCLVDSKYTLHSIGQPFSRQMGCRNSGATTSIDPHKRRWPLPVDKKDSVVCSIYDPCSDDNKTIHV
jgi:hypothetical protein